MKLRAISGLRTGLQRAALRLGIGEDDSSVTRSSLAPVPRIAPLSRRDTYQKMNVGLSAWQFRLKKPSRRQAANQTPAAGLEAAVAALALADIIPIAGLPSPRRSVPLRKTVMQLRTAFARKPRSPGRLLDKSGLDHDTLPGADNDRDPDGFKSHDIPSATGPIDATIASPRGSRALPYRLLGVTDEAGRRQVEKKFLR